MHQKIPVTNKSVVTGIFLFQRAVLRCIKTRAEFQPLVRLNNTIAIEIGAEVAVTCNSATGVIL